MRCYVGLWAPSEGLWESPVLRPSLASRRGAWVRSPISPMDLVTRGSARFPSYALNTWIGTPPAVADLVALNRNLAGGIPILMHRLVDAVKIRQQRCPLMFSGRSSRSPRPARIGPPMSRRRPERPASLLLDELADAPASH